MRAFIAIAVVGLLAACSADVAPKPKPVIPDEVVVEVVNSGSNICDELGSTKDAPCYPYLFAEPTVASQVLNSEESTRCSKVHQDWCYPLKGTQLRAVCSTVGQNVEWYGVIVVKLVGVTAITIPHNYKGEPLGYLQAATATRQDKTTALKECSTVVS